MIVGLFTPALDAMQLFREDAYWALYDIAKIRFI